MLIQPKVFMPIVKLGLLALLTLSTVGCKKQEILFEAQSISYKQKDSYAVMQMEKECSDLSKELKSYLDNGWRVIASSPKEKLVGGNRGTCVGTEYILEK
ncbi:hypothetical protein [Thauera butanivorans]|uniref:hypothetical protein n=1 Tax=Thauera butanivorans TaxID=86174 RepID=UPI0012FBA9C0|nr:hypothetical protein [Thauera butanivorans]